MEGGFTKGNNSIDFKNTQNNLPNNILHISNDSNSYKLSTNNKLWLMMTGM